MLQGQTSGVRGVATPTPSGVRMVLVSMSFVDIFVWPTEFFLSILVAVETGSGVLDFTSLLGGPQVFGERTQNRGKALCLGVTGNILWPAG